MISPGHSLPPLDLSLLPTYPEFRPWLLLAVRGPGSWILVRSFQSWFEAIDTRDAFLLSTDPGLTLCVRPRSSLTQAQFEALPKLAH